MITAAIIVLTLLSVYWYWKNIFKYWKMRGVKHDKPIPFFGNNARNFLAIKSITQVTMDVYTRYPEERVVGFYRSSQPELVIRDPEIIKRVLVTDFLHFYPRGLNSHNDITEVEPMLRNVFFGDGDLWRLLRQRMTPAFSTGKVRAMFPLVVERAERLQAFVLAAATDRPLNANDLMARYNIDFIGACGFGLDANSLNDEHSPFRKLGKKIFESTIRDVIIVMLKDILPNLCKHLKYFGHFERDLNELVKNILEERKYEPSGRNDFIDLLIECRKKGLMQGESMVKMKADGTPEMVRLEMTTELMASQAFIFFAAGFETSSFSTSFTLHQLAYYPEVQQRVQTEIDHVLAKYDGKLCYDAVKEMLYLECAFKESIRILPSIGFLVRVCARPYTFSELNFTIEEGVKVVIPVQALQNDPKYFEDPSEFRPERFLPNEFDSETTKFVYLPFGDGPRACIGKRLGLMQSLAGLAAILMRFTVEPAPDTVRYPDVDPKAGIVQRVKNGLPLMFRERKL